MRPVETERSSLYARRAKRAFDITLAVLLLPLIGPIILLLWAITRRDGAPGFFGHQRVGQNGRMFRCWKIRTMVHDAEKRLEECLNNCPEAASEWALYQKLSDDPRVTSMGKFLRRTSLDELPQIWNVLRGDMSFVGPRPVTLQELDRYGPHKSIYLSLRPGITGLWQVDGRTNGCYDERLRMDRAYASKLCFSVDMQLILRTARVVVQPTGR
ncbi:sugar transferase [uncultured Tateyamaria sp.]|uniref:sugar transferase n=1 Tax=uncultured Tateyamaria sp. TaxID=455651 RepID=UPI002636BE72|nr:sugar transferase [uncultured Tateyamaria sp.]